MAENERLPGRPDSEFAVPGVPITKEEVRVLSLAKLGLRRGDRLYDVGAGTGAVAIEAALWLSPGEVYAFERDPERFRLLAGRLAQSGPANVHLVNGEAPTVWEGLPLPDRIFVGGSGGRLPEILRAADAVLPRGGRLVLNAVTLETVAEALGLFAELGWEEEVISVQIAKAERAGRSHLFRARNPVFILRGEKA